MSDLSNLTNNTEKEKMHLYLPDFYNNATLYFLLWEYLEQKSSMFYDDIDIKAVYGSFPSCIWNGGRVYLDYISRPIMDKIISEFNARGIAIRYTFTNPLLEEKHMYDTFGNICLEAADNGKNEVLVNTQVIEDYVRKNYPGYKLISSTTKCIKSLEGVEKELDKDYYLVVLDSSLNKDERIFNIAKRDRLELLVNHSCALNCPRRAEHYIQTGRCQLTYNYVNIECPNLARPFAEIMKEEHAISRELMVEKYFPGGIKHFKLDGRSFAPEKLVDSLMYFMVRPEYRDQVKETIKKAIYKGRPSW